MENAKSMELIDSKRDWNRIIWYMNGLSRHNHLICTVLIKSCDKQQNVLKLWIGCVSYLWLWEHVQAPWTHFTIGRDADQIVSILRPHHINTVNGMLKETFSVEKNISWKY